MGELSSKWRAIGLRLHMRQCVLNDIEAHPGDQRMTAMLTEWLNQNYNVTKFGKPTWEKLVEAVEHRTGGANPALAREIERRHSCKDKRQNLKKCTL